MLLMLFLVSSLLLLLILVVRHSAYVERYNDPSYLSTLLITSPEEPLTIRVPDACLPCTRTLRVLRAIKAPLTPTMKIGDGDVCDLTCTDLVSLSLLAPGTHMIVAACPSNDLVLSIVACLGQGGLPPTPLTSRGLTLMDVAEAGDEILCSGPAEARLIADICACARITVSTSQIVEGTSLKGSTVAYLRPPENTDVIKALARPNAVIVHLPERMDPSLFALHQPVATLDGERISSTCVLVGNERLSGPRVAAVIHALTGEDQFWALGELNLASKFEALALLPLTRTILRPIDAAALTRQDRTRLTTASYAIPRVNVLSEGFADPLITLQTYEPVEAYMSSTTRDGKCRVLHTRHAFIGAARMRRGDRVVLSEQPVQKHDGAYIVQASRTDGGMVLVSWTEVTYDAVSFTDVEQTATAAVVMDMALRDVVIWPDDVMLQVNDMLLLHNLHNPDGGTGVWTKVTEVRDTSVTVQTVLPGDSYTAASDGSCVSSPTTEIKSVCKSSEGGLWDAPCTSDDQCPYFQKNRRYPNYRGGCLESGWCEMPLGVVQSSFRTSVGVPLCHNDRDSEAQCTDTAFPLDEFERRVFGFKL